MRISFRAKIMLGIAVVQAVLLLALISGSLGFLRSSNEQEVQKRAATAARLFAAATKEAVLATDLATLEGAVAEVMTSPDIAYARVRDARGVLAQAGDARALARAVRADARIGDAVDGIFDAAADIGVGGAVFGRVEIGLSVAAVGEVIERARRHALAIAAGAIIAITLVSFALGSSLTRGLDALAEGTRRVAAGALGHQIDVRSSDELGRTARAFNDMSRELQAADDERRRAETELARIKDGLELLVAQRTEELTRANQMLTDVNRRLTEAHHQFLQAEKAAAIGRLAAGIAHEINNPVGFVISNLSSLERYLHKLFVVIDACDRNEDRLPADRAEAMTKVKQEAELEFLREDAYALLTESNGGLQRVKKIVRDLLDFSRLEGGEWQPTDIHHGLDGALDIVADELKHKATVVKAYGNLPAVECMPLELKRVFMNLLLNAVQAIAERGEISIGTGIEGDEVWIDIADTGQGIAPEILGRVFDPFFTTRPVGQGIGLGLSVAYSIVQQHHGRIEATSMPDRGTTFRVWLPQRRPEPPGDEAARGERITPSPPRPSP